MDKELWQMEGLNQNLRLNTLLFKIEQPLEFPQKKSDEIHMRFRTLFNLFLLLLPIYSCSPPKLEEKPPAKTPTPIAPPAVTLPYEKRIQLNSGSGFGTTTQAFKTSVSVGNTSGVLSGTTTNGYRVKYNVQNPNSAR